MANTGTLIPVTLKEVEMPSGTPTGNTKPNTPKDPDYIAPFVDTVSCPVTFIFSCFTMIATGETNSILFEFSLPNSIVGNPVLKTVRVTAQQAAVVKSTVDFTIPKTNPNYFAGELTGLTLGQTYDIVVEYLDVSSGVLGTCSVTTAPITTNSTNPSST